MQLPDLGLGPVPPPHVVEAIPYYKVMQNSLVGLSVLSITAGQITYSRSHAVVRDLVSQPP
jgi:hypothetical protein